MMKLLTKAKYFERTDPLTRLFFIYRAYMFYMFLFEKTFISMQNINTLVINTGL